MYKSIACAELDGKTHKECRDPDCECKHEKCKAITLEGMVECMLHKDHPGEHYCLIEWELDERII